MHASPPSSRRGRKALLLLPLLCGLVPPASAEAAWIRKTPPLSTPWTAQVSPTNALPEYPRPQLVRTDWQNLNGEWQFANASAGQAPPFNQTLPESVLVPFPIESALSGIQRHQDRMWYRRTFTIPSGWSGRRVQLHFGAVDWEATVYVNGQSVGSHKGGFDGFSFDITDRLKAGAANELIVGVYDPTSAGEQPVGKQRLNPGGIWYTPASGIWQTVWLEPTPAARVTRLDMTPDVAGQALKITVQGAGTSGHTVELTAFDGTTQVGRITGNVGTELRLPVPNPKLWSPESPFLYDLRVALKSGTTTVDQATSYFGMRSVGLKLVGGALRPVLNGQFVFQMGTLDQGYWPDGIFTAPTDEALKFDIQKHKDLGYNLLRKHIKVEPQRWFYWADKLGILVWQDMPSMERTPSAAGKAQFESEMREMIDEHRSATSVIMWVVQNEGWGQYDQARLATLVKGWDPSRLVDNMSGINCCGAVDGGNGDVADWHTYVGPSSPVPSASRAAVLGEFGGLGLRVAGHEWSPGNGFGYEMMSDATALTNRYVGLMQRSQQLMVNPGLSAAVYTEITDVENEINGMLTYDRVIMKPNVAQVRAAHDSLIAASRQLNSQGPLPLNQFRSFQVTTPGFTDRYLRHLDSLGFTAAITGATDGLTKKDATFKIVRGLADAACYSFESRNYPGSYLRHFNSRIRRDANDGSSTFAQDATFCGRNALDGSGNISLESKNKPGAYLRHRAAEVWVEAFTDTTGFRQDATWALAAPWWKSGVDLAVNTYHSLQVTNAGLTNRYLRHSADLAYTEVVDGGSSATLKQDATFRTVPGLADTSCYSFESRNFPGHYLRHAGDRLRKNARDGSALFDQDATFCAQPGLGGTGVSLEAVNYPGRYLRHFTSEVWIADGSGGGWNGNFSFNTDVSWNVVAPWAP
ncbi:Glycosyl hydrolases family 2, TIM barrel domain [Stigmatella aurantiaca]|uniref:Glycosyl hydrolases family 2, TIM barrel domain n=1 Tax=Stigmatella aurantiaca TaxID=41 RepID=A0A1H7K2W1_STIAU|nr:AbfB domain-containing protein [Stigmatella aurantiaca]SEK80760.1 Glycosyl hydrolases family 2, TIM barrel domain [Stigmatella aurantiaca]